MNSSHSPIGRHLSRVSAVAVALGLVVVALIALPITSAAPIAPTAAPTATEPTWAYGAIHNGSVNWQGQHGQFIGTASYGFSTILTQINTSVDTFSLTENHTVGASVQLTYCRPSCTAANFTARYNARAWEQWTSVANFTTSGSVTLRNPTTVPALALVSTSTQAAANITESLTYTANGTTHLFDQLFVAVTATSSIAFSPALGLTPLNLTPGATWSAASVFTAVGSWQSSYRVILPVTQLMATRTGNFTGTGNVTLYGSVLGPLDVQGQPSTQVAVRLGALTVRHGSTDLALGFDLQDGFALIPRAANIWASTGTWGSSMAMMTSAGASVIDMTGTVGGHLGLEAASWSYSTSVNQYDSPSNADASAVQGAPMTPAAAQSSAGCLTGGACTSSGTATSSSATGLGTFGLFMIVGVAVAAVVVILAVVLIRRR